MESSDIFENCQFFVKRKKRFCRMTVKTGNRFCGEHMESPANGDEVSGSEPHRRRVQCPIDPTHTCYESRLSRHLKVCNAKRLVDAQPSYIVRGVNLGDADIEGPKRVPLSELSQTLLEVVIKKVEDAYERLPSVLENILCDDLLKSEIDNPSYGNNLRKHLLQNASLLAHVKRCNLAQKNTCFIEFGAGKGKLTYWLAQAIKDHAGSSVLLVDRSSHRHKSDNKLKNEECPINVTRIRADIADLRLSGVPEIKQIDHIVGIAKHLCGAATDLTIRCLIGLMQDDPKSRVAGLLIAFCCHHRCEYSSYTGKEYLRSCGFTPDEFPILCSIASWATCGTGKNRDAATECKEVRDRNVTERECVGRKVKSLLNWGRIEYLNSVGFDSSLLYYTPREVSLENMCVIAVRKNFGAQCIQKRAASVKHGQTWTAAGHAAATSGLRATSAVHRWTTTGPADAVRCSSYHRAASCLRPGDSGDDLPLLPGFNLDSCDERDELQDASLRSTALPHWMLALRTVCLLCGQLSDEETLLSRV